MSLIESEESKELESCIKLTPLPVELSSQVHDMLLTKIKTNLFQGKKRKPFIMYIIKLVFWIVLVGIALSGIAISSGNTLLMVYSKLFAGECYAGFNYVRNVIFTGIAPTIANWISDPVCTLWTQWGKSICLAIGQFVLGGTVKYFLNNVVSQYLITLTPIAVTTLYSAFIGNDPNIAVTAGLTAAFTAIDYAFDKCSLYVYNKWNGSWFRLDEFQGTRNSSRRRSCICRIKRNKSTKIKCKRSCKK
jgi:hypothetical protein